MSYSFTVKRKDIKNQSIDRMTVDSYVLNKLTASKGYIVIRGHRNLHNAFDTIIKEFPQYRYACYYGMKFKDSDDVVIIKYEKEAELSERQKAIEILANHIAENAELHNASFSYGSPYERKYYRDAIDILADVLYKDYEKNVLVDYIGQKISKVEMDGCVYYEEV